MINSDWQALGVGLMDTEKSRESSPETPQESICPCSYNQSPSVYRILMAQTPEHLVQSACINEDRVRCKMQHCKSGVDRVQTKNAKK